MEKMRQMLATNDLALGFTYGCSAHLLNLLAKDIEIPVMKTY